MACRPWLAVGLLALVALEGCASESATQPSRPTITDAAMRAFMLSTEAEPMKPEQFERLRDRALQSARETLAAYDSAKPDEGVADAAVAAAQLGELDLAE